MAALSLKAGGLTHSGPSQPLHLKPLPTPPSPFLPHLPCLHQSEPGKKGRPWVQNQVLLFIVCVTLGITDAVPEPQFPCLEIQENQAYLI